ncbi:hypothetical protein [Streptomyces sp. NPDC002537]
MPFMGSDPDRRPVLPRRAATDRGRFSAGHDHMENLPRLGNGRLPASTGEFHRASA